MLSRRDVLVSFLGVSAASAACRRRAREPVPGALVDRAVTTGHRLREAAPLPRATQDTARLEVLVVGAGVAGLSAAWRLRAAGVDRLLVLEVDEDVGGTSRSGRNGVGAFPWGAHYLPAPLTGAGPVPRLLKELGVLTGVDERGAPTFAEEVLIHAPEERVFYRGAWYEGLYLRAGATPEDLAELARFEAQVGALSAAHDAKGRKAFAVPLEAGSDDAEWTQLDALSMAQWLEREGFTSARLRWLVDYACRDDYGAAAADTSAWAGLWYFCARRAGEAENEGFLSWSEGNGRLVRHLAEAAGTERLRPGVLVHTLARDGDSWVAHAWDAAAQAPLRFRARQVVLAAPRFVAGHVVEAWRAARPAFLDAFSYSPWVVANLTMSAPPLGRGFPLAWDNVLYESKSLGYVVSTHQLLRGTDVGPTVLTWYYPLAGSDVKAERARLLETTYADWERIVLADLVPAHLDFARHAQRLEVMRWGHAMIRPRPGFVWGEARRAAQASLGGSLHFAHSDLGGLALFEEANWHGVRAAEQALAGLGRVTASWL